MGTARAAREDAVSRARRTVTKRWGKARRLDGWLDFRVLMRPMETGVTLLALQLPGCGIAGCEKPGVLLDPWGVGYCVPHARGQGFEDTDRAITGGCS